MTKEQKEKAKKLLSSYRTMKAQIECIDFEINIIKECIEGLRELRDSDNYIIESNKEIEHKRAIRNRLEDCINSVDNALNELSDTERKIVELRYLEGKKHTWREIGNIVGYSSDYCRKELLNKSLKSLYENIKDYCKLVAKIQI
ncbi:sigma factor-like helix-turn-helix DNA-binding protein [Clostridium perfringens]|uniref:sigma factor-like helix-turn-helix DNA-binding protein n=2 Tax=Clostridium perfringens TaxID=1502 RepID=UPI0010E3F41B|nr:sigma factor-like helix-turn-helix DNA-binding protein [Clostridium perfringens]MBO3395852.1 sigma-70 family RNA polymerase sigma factor [Clostridium perfringens]MBO3402505.1 sigma-70 family RNA polymerase sigma factor [Clostridium perfringens]MDU1476580.1 sigma factor-like helix-turn-helix DNA-binding protein [Clostridium perfringens]MDU2827921.1 sigma factor-like helix-turn-helix DNA-binding protein [Clostridium perfringens]MDU4419875.1 sigma factor-like helix-turn-helix DNA-binding prote